MDYEKHMRLALGQANMAKDEGEVPIGCVIVGGDGQVIGTGRNMTAQNGNSLHHAEILAIGKACEKVGDWRLSDATLFVTIEPCPMCAGAILMCSMGTLVYGAKNPKAGCAGSLYNLLDDERFNHKVNIHSGVLGDECAALMSQFFKERRLSQETIARTCGQ